MFAESENDTSPIRLTDGSLSFPSTYRELISRPRKLTIAFTLSSPILPDVSRAIMMSEPRKQAVKTSPDTLIYSINNHLLLTHFIAFL